MTVQISKISDDFSVAPQISVLDIDFILQSGFKSVINNRPDGEAGDLQPTSTEIQQAVEGAGMKYAYIPVVNGQLTQAQVDEHVKQSFELYKERSKHDWELDISILEEKPYEIKVKKFTKRIFVVKKYKKRKRKTVAKKPTKKKINRRPKK